MVCGLYDLCNRQNRKTVCRLLGHMAAILLINVDRKHLHANFLLSKPFTMVSVVRHVRRGFTFKQLVTAFGFLLKPKFFHGNQVLNLI